MELESRHGMTGQVTRVGLAFATLLVGMVVATGSLWLFGQGNAMGAAVSWFVSWLIIWTSLPLIGHALHFKL